MLKGSTVDVKCARCKLDTLYDGQATDVRVAGVLGTFRSRDRLCGRCTTAFYGKFMRNQEIVESAE